MLDQIVDSIRNTRSCYLPFDLKTHPKIFSSTMNSLPKKITIHTTQITIFLASKHNSCKQHIGAEARRSKQGPGPLQDILIFFITW